MGQWEKKISAINRESGARGIPLRAINSFIPPFLKKKLIGVLIHAAIANLKSKFRIPKERAKVFYTPIANTLNQDGQRGPPQSVLHESPDIDKPKTGQSVKKRFCKKDGKVKTSAAKEKKSERKGIFVLTLLAVWVFFFALHTTLYAEENTTPEKPQKTSVKVEKTKDNKNDKKSPANAKKGEKTDKKNKSPKQTEKKKETNKVAKRDYKEVYVEISEEEANSMFKKEIDPQVKMWYANDLTDELYKNLEKNISGLDLYQLDRFADELYNFVYYNERAKWDQNGMATYVFVKTTDGYFYFGAVPSSFVEKTEDGRIKETNGVEAWFVPKGIERGLNDEESVKEFDTIKVRGDLIMFIRCPPTDGLNGYIKDLKEHVIDKNGNLLPGGPLRLFLQEHKTNIKINYKDKYGEQKEVTIPIKVFSTRITSYAMIPATVKDLETLAELTQYEGYDDSEINYKLVELDGFALDNGVVADVSNDPDGANKIVTINYPGSEIYSEEDYWKQRKNNNIGGIIVDYYDIYIDENKELQIKKTKHIGALIKRKNETITAIKDKTQKK